jgi:hypothetical protein
MPIQVLRGVHESVRQVSALDLEHDAEELTSKVFHTFPSVYPGPARTLGKMG